MYNEIINPSISLLIASQLSSIVCSNMGNSYSASRIEIERKNIHNGNCLLISPGKYNRRSLEGISK